MSFKLISHILSAALVASGTITPSYPDGFRKGSFNYGTRHRIRAGNTQLEAPKDFTITHGTTTFTVTMSSTAPTIPAGTTLLIELDRGTDQNTERQQSLRAMGRNGIASLGELVYVDFGSPITADADGICASQSVTLATAALLNGALLSGGKMVFDVPRNVVGAWTTAAIITITGKDDEGAVMVEKSASGTSHTGKKAFKEITSIVPSASITGATFGTGDVLGLPFAVKSANQIVKELENGVAMNAANRVFIPWEIEQTELLAPTAEQIVSPVAGYISRIRGIVQGAVTTGGVITVEINTVAVTGLTFTVADADAAGVRYSDAPTTPRSSTTVLAVGDAITITPSSPFATAGSLNGILEIETAGITGTFVAADEAQQSGTSGDVRGTYDPATACDGLTGFGLWVLAPDPTNVGADQYTG